MPLDSEEQEVLALVDDWLSTTPEIFDDGEDDDFWYDEDDEYMNFLFDSEEE